MKPLLWATPLAVALAWIAWPEPVGACEIDCPSDGRLATLTEVRLIEGDALATPLELPGEASLRVGFDGTVTSLYIDGVIYELIEVEP